ncbi:hypothetical protein SEA_COLUCCI_6 [Arthrobacter phage Colucci]|uniref:Uncharacterized protein n=1 Tax=Arthrobacter phage Colucci TaxID=2015834 RepID=A0A286N2S0_9CAUD|nr:immunity protein [Arthrobacter phage Colucci]ASX98677.1 hypothetical protein SEA_COLUCCI_6 [Arthrobacter phage Colucci]
MAIDFEQAREAVRAHNEPLWEDEDQDGTYMVADYGLEDATAFLVIDGAREYLEDGDDDFVVMDAPAVFVDKGTGTVLLADYLDARARIRAMTPVPGHEPPTYDGD